MSTAPPALSSAQNLQLSAAITAGMMAYVPGTVQAGGQPPFEQVLALHRTWQQSHLSSPFLAPNIRGYFVSTFVTPVIKRNIGWIASLYPFREISAILERSDSDLQAAHSAENAVDVQLQSALKMIDYLPKGFLFHDDTPNTPWQEKIAGLSPEDIALLLRVGVVPLGGDEQTWQLMVDNLVDFRRALRGEEPLLRVGRPINKGTLHSSAIRIQHTPTHKPARQSFLAMTNISFGNINQGANQLSGIAVRYGAMHEHRIASFYWQLAGTARVEAARRLRDDDSAILSSHSLNIDHFKCRLFRDARNCFDRSGNFIAGDNAREELIQIPAWAYYR